jgi:hypothetical protein
VSSTRKPTRSTKEKAKPISVIVEPITAEVEADLVDRIARFLACLLQPEEQGH